MIVEVATMVTAKGITAAVVKAKAQAHQVVRVQRMRAVTGLMERVMVVKIEAKVQDQLGTLEAHGTAKAGGPIAGTKVLTSTGMNEIVESGVAVAAALLIASIHA